MIMEWFYAGFFAPLGLWVSLLLTASAWAFAKRLMKG
jgi:hypothetical protein